MYPARPAGGPRRPRSKPAPVTLKVITPRPLGDTERRARQTDTDARDPFGDICYDILVEVALAPVRAPACSAKHFP